MRLNYKPEKHVWWQAPVVAIALAAGAKMKLDAAMIPLTLQTFFLCLTALFLGRQANMLGVFLYLVAGIWLPVFSRDIYGQEFFYSVNAGYVYAFPLAAYMIATSKPHYKDWLGCFAWLLMAHVAILLIGGAWAVLYSDFPVNDVIRNGFYGMLPGAIIKSAGAATLYWIAKKYILKEENQPTA